MNWNLGAPSLRSNSALTSSVAQQMSQAYARIDQTWNTAQWKAFLLGVSHTKELMFYASSLVNSAVVIRRPIWFPLKMITTNKRPRLAPENILAWIVGTIAEAANVSQLCPPYQTASCKLCLFLKLYWLSNRWRFITKQLHCFWHVFC